MASREISEETKRQIELGARFLPDPIAKFESLLCGCGNTAAVWSDLLQYLERCDAKEWGEDPRTGPEWLFLYAAYWAGLTGHGVGVRCSWIEDDGRIAMEFLREHGPKWSDNGLWVDATGLCYGRP